MTHAFRTDGADLVKGSMLALTIDAIWSGSERSSLSRLAKPSRSARLDVAYMLITDLPGLALFGVICMFGAVSGGHFNPAVTLAAWTIKKISTIDGIIYILAQLSGAVLGALLTKGLLLDEGRATHYGAAEVSGLLAGNFAGSIVEAVGTFCLVLVILAAVYSKKSLKDWAPLAIGTTLGFIVMVGGPLTGGAFNPARWFGPALVGNDFGGVWPYLAGPIVGALLAAAVFKFVLEPGGAAPTEPPERVKPKAAPKPGAAS